ncbi:unnamed protein product [Urochloa humidicola]
MAQFSGMDEHKRVEWMWKNCRETHDAAKACLQTNYYGTKKVTEALLPLLLSSSDGRIVNVTSGCRLLRFFRSEELKQELDNVDKLIEERLDELLDEFLKHFEAGAVVARGWPADRVLGLQGGQGAKAAVNAYSRVLARRHPELRVNVVDPGYVRTHMTRNSGLLAPEDGERPGSWPWRCSRKVARPVRSLAAARRRRRSCDRKCSGTARLVFGSGRARVASSHGLATSAVLRAVLVWKRGGMGLERWNCRRAERSKVTMLID